MPDFDVVEFGETDHPEPGDEAPDFTRPLVTDEFWADASLSDLLDDGPVLLVFYPMNWGGKSIYTWNEIRDREWGDGVQIAGISIGTPFDNGRFIEARGMDYPLFSDPGNGVASRYGISHELDGMTGIAEPRPGVFLIERDRTVAYSWVATEWPEAPPYDEIEEVLETR